MSNLNYSLNCITVSICSLYYNSMTNSVSDLTIAIEFDFRRSVEFRVRATSSRNRNGVHWVFVECSMNLISSTRCVRCDSQQRTILILQVHVIRRKFNHSSRPSEFEIHSDPVISYVIKSIHNHQFPSWILKILVLPCVPFFPLRCTQSKSQKSGWKALGAR